MWTVWGSMELFSLHWKGFETEEGLGAPALKNSFFKRSKNSFGKFPPKSAAEKQGQLSS